MKILVTGAGGFIGGVLATRLKSLGHDIITLQRGDYPALETAGIETIRGDLTDLATVQRAANGCDVVFHVAALAAVWGPAIDFHRTNVIGTRNVIQACRLEGVTRLIYTSSPSVVFDGHDQEGIDEKTPYPDKFLAHYPRTKAMAEREVLAANDTQLSTVALRPHLVWGPGDRHLIPRIAERACAGTLRWIDRPGVLIDATYIENAIDAHIAAMQALLTSKACCGKVYFISNGEPTPPRELISGILSSLNIRDQFPSISPGLAYGVATLLEWIHKIPGVHGEPSLTRFSARQLSTSHWFDLSAAKNDLHWVPRVTTAEGIEQLCKNHYHAASQTT